MLRDPANYFFGVWFIPKPMQVAIRMYLHDHILDDEFLEAIVTNDLIGAFAHADNYNVDRIKMYVQYFYDEAPSNSWGSKEKVQAWINQGKSEETASQS